MPTKRTRRGRGNVVPQNIMLLLGLGTAMNSYRLEELKRLWASTARRLPNTGKRNSARIHSPQRSQNRRNGNDG